MAIGDVSEGKSADYDGNDRATPSLRDLVRPFLTLFLVGLTSYELFEDRIVALATVFGAAFIYAGKAAFLQLGGVGDGFAYAFLVVALAFRNPASIALAVFAACFTDERAYVAAPLIGVYWGLRGTGGKFFRLEVLATGVGVVAALAMRLMLHKVYGLYVPLGDGKDAGLDVLPRTLPLIQYLIPRVLAGLWLWPVAGVVLLARNRRWLSILLISTPVVGLVLVSFMVIDNERSLAYMLPLVFVGMAAVKRHEADILAVRKLAIWAMLITVLLPANNFFSGDSRYSPGNLMPVEIVRLTYYAWH